MWGKNGQKDHILLQKDICFQKKHTLYKLQGILSVLVKGNVVK